MAKVKQEAQDVQQEDNYLFAIGTPEGDILVKVGVDGNLMYIKNDTTLEEAARAFWNSFEFFLPITDEEVKNYPNDAELGAYVRARMTSKLQNK